MTERIKIYDMRANGVYLPIRYYARPDQTKVVLVATLHKGSGDFYKKVAHILNKCDTVIYEEPCERDADTMRELDNAWSQILSDENLDEAMLAAIFFPMPQKFMHNHLLREEDHCFDYSQVNWISGDAEWNKKRPGASLLEEDWIRIRENIKSMDLELKEKKVAAARRFLKKANNYSASMLDYIDFGNLYEDEIQEIVFRSVLVDPRDEIALGVLDHVTDAIKQSRIGIKFSNGHICHMDRLLRDRGYALTTVKWLRILTVFPCEQ